MFPLRDNIPSRRVPVVTYGLILANVVVYLYQLTLGQEGHQQFMYLFGIVPRRYTHPAWAEWVGFPMDSYWPFLTSMFLHGGFFHLLVNMWTLYIFGDNVEDRMGPLRFLAFYIICGVAAGLAHLITNFSSVIPVVGASGAIAGVLAAYLFMYPLAVVVCLVPVFFYPLLLPVPAFLYMIIWFVTQFFSGALSLFSPETGGGIAWWAHIGGFVAGVLLLRYFVKRGPPPRPGIPDRPRRVAFARPRRW